jgi:hypothetical protein
MRCRQIACPVQVALKFSRSAPQRLPHSLIGSAFLCLVLQQSLAVGELHERRKLLILWQLLIGHTKSVIDDGGVKVLPE